MITVFYTDYYENLSEENLELTLEECIEIFSETIDLVDNFVGITVGAHTMQFHCDEDRILVEVLNPPTLVNPQMYADKAQCLAIIKDIYAKQQLFVYPQMKLVDVRKESLDDVLEREA
ncbi:hypothetical protein HX045_01385 [Myroides odoratimimus]|uniref:Uncharacterized protein n=1 Tax=Myroides profundi TaxID=480520 RepID=A0AAJ4W2Y0_MYRPR|nr:MULTISPECIES: hypothetical protein [Myroides]AJH16292.1 hypothetical protein MPR_3166 [Myroides profundi]MCA4791821.1 hypothetical protein [Myroides odoratimimus]MCA4805635.1 hypothetical protein [Myroides odoratimimus]MCA4819082.1 hypothetical protein [Myroides odoratimimus]MDM1059189.1 hypothetical protein [Myroides odoratimimus]